MPWTPPLTVSVGDVGKASFWNEQVRDNLKALRRCAIAALTGFASTGWGYTGAFTVQVDDFNYEFGGANGFGGASGTTFVAHEAGVYEVMVSADWTGATGAGSCGVRIDHMTTLGGLIETPGSDESSVLNGSVSTSALIALAASEEIRIAGYASASGVAGSLAVRVSIAQRG